MTQQTFVGPADVRIPAYNQLLTFPISATNTTLDALNEACHMVGFAYLQGRTGSKTLSAAGGGKIWWMPGTVGAFANGSTNLRIGVQDLDATTQAPMRGDGTFDVYADLVGGTDTITTATWRSDAMESGSKSISHGAPISIAFELTSYGGADSVMIRGASTVVTGAPGTTVVTAGPTYNTVAALPSALIEFDDGSYGWIQGSYITSTGAMFTNTSVAVNTGTFDEWGTIFQVPFPCQVDSLWAIMGPSAAAADYELILYSDPLGSPTKVETIVMQGSYSQVTSQRRIEVPLTTVRTLSANTDYCVSIRPTATTAVSITSFDVSTAAHLIAHPCGTNSNVAKRLDDAGAFTEVTTTRIMTGVHVCAWGDDASSGGGGQRIIGG